MSVEDPPLEEVIAEMFSQAADAEQPKAELGGRKRTRGDA